MYALLKPSAESGNIKPSFRDHDEVRIEEPALTHSLRRQLLNRHKRNFNWQEGGPDSPVKYLDRDSVEYSLTQSAMNNSLETRMAKMTLYRSLALQDKVWGGICQYATGNWQSPHYVMTMGNQAGCLRIYALSYALWKNRLFRDAAIRIRKYLSRFLLSPVNAFYSGQDDRIRDCDAAGYYALEEEQRLHFGVPATDTRILTRENGWAIEALACCHEFCNDPESLQLATDAAEWILAHRKIGDGGFINNEQLSYRLGDTLAMARAFLQLYRVSADPDWLNRAINAADFIALHFYHRGGGYVPEINTRSSRHTGPGIDENLSLMRFANLLWYYSGMQRHRKMAKHCFRFLCRDEVATSRVEETGILLAEQEYHEQPVRIMILGQADDRDAQQLHRTALDYHAWYKHLAWYSPDEAPVNAREIYYGDRAVAVVKHSFCKTTTLYDARLLENFLANI